MTIMIFVDYKLKQQLQFESSIQILGLEIQFTFSIL